MYSETATSILEVLTDMNIRSVPAAAEQPEENDLEGFVHGLMQDVRKRFSGNGISPSMLRPAQEYMDHEWADFCRYHPGPYMLAAGCAVSGLRVGMLSGKIMFQWGTAFHPRPRYPGPETSIQALGFYSDYDLYLTFPPNGLPELTARSGPGDQVAHWDVSLKGLDPPHSHESPLREALARVLRANALWGTRHARPAPLGAIAMPRKKLA